MDLSALFSAVLGGLVVGLPFLVYVAKRTKNTTDDKVVELLEKVLNGIGTSPQK